MALANTARWIVTLGVGSWLYGHTRSSAWVGASFFTLQAPTLLVSPLAGVLADRHNRRLVLTLALGLGVGGTGALTVLTALDAGSPLAVVLCTAVLGVAFSIQTTAWTALLPNVIARDDLSSAFALQGTASHGAEFLGPLIASPLLVAFGPAPVFSLALACYLLATAQPLRITSHLVTRIVIQARPFASLVEGLRYARGTPLLGTVIAVVALHCSLTMTYQGLLPDYVMSELHRGDDVYGAMMTMIGLGSIVGTVALALLKSRRVFSLAYGFTAAGSGVALLFMGLAPGEVIALVTSFAAGATQATFMVISLTYAQELADEAYRGRVSSVYNFFAGGTMAFLSWGFGGLASVTLPAPILLIAGVTFTLLVGVAAIGYAPFRRLCSSATVLSPSA